MDWDVIVVGLGTAGTDAALTAARLGLRTLGVERTGAMGGQYTSGGICFGQRPPVESMLAFEREAEKAGLVRAYETVPLAVGKRDGRLVSVTLVSDGATRTETARVFIDATGNGTLAHLAGLPLRRGRPHDGAMARPARAELWKEATGTVRPYYSNWNVKLDGDAAAHAASVAFLGETRLKAFRDLRGRARMLRPATLVGAREERRVVTERIVTFRDLLRETAWDDPVFYGFGPEDYVQPDTLAYESDDLQNWKLLCFLPAFGYPYAIPYGTLVAKGVANLLVPSKHLGVSHDCGGAIRMQPEMRKSGRAAACAAKVMCMLGCAARDVPYAELRPLLLREGTLAKPNRTAVETVNGFAFGRPFTDDEIVAALSRPVVRSGEWWNSTAKDGPGERAAYAYWCCWKTALTGRAADRAARADRLAAEMGKGGPCAGNFAVALGLLEDARCVPVLRALLRAPGPANDPTGPGIYPNRLKAIPLLARFGDRESVPLLRVLRADGAQAFTADIPARTGIFASPAAWRAEALAWVGTALARLER